MKIHKFNGVELTKICPECKNHSPEECGECEGSGSALTKEGQELSDFMYIYLAPRDTTAQKLEKRVRALEKKDK